MTCYNRYTGAPYPQAHLAFKNGLDVSSDSHVWFLDIGATNHATPDFATLFTLEEYIVNGTLCFGDGMGLSISSIGHASFNTPSRLFRMSDILQVHCLSTSLLSI